MKVKKIIVLFFLIFILTGCTVNYDLNISDKVISENISIIDYNEVNWDIFKSYGSYSMDDTTYRDLINNYAKEDSVIYSMNDNSGNYDKEIINNSNSLGIKLNYDYKLDEFYKESLIRNCYKYFSVNNDNGVYTLSTSKVFMCFNNDNPLLDRVNVKIKVDYEVIENNADSFSDNEYIWNINKENAGNKPIILSFRVDKAKGNIFEEVLFNDDKVSIAIIIFALAFVIGIVIFAFIKNKKNNKI